MINNDDSIQILLGDGGLLFINSLSKEALESSTIILCINEFSVQLFERTNKKKVFMTINFKNKAVILNDKNETHERDTSKQKKIKSWIIHCIKELKYSGLTSSSNEINNILAKENIQALPKEETQIALNNIHAIIKTTDILSPEYKRVVNGATHIHNIAHIIIHKIETMWKNTSTTLNIEDIQHHFDVLAEHDVYHDHIDNDDIDEQIFIETIQKECAEILNEGAYPKKSVVISNVGDKEQPQTFQYSLKITKATLTFYEQEPEKNKQIYEYSFENHHYSLNNAPQDASFSKIFISKLNIVMDGIKSHSVHFFEEEMLQ